MAKNQVNVNYLNQSYEAKKRGIDWQFTYESWVSWWGSDYKYRGKGKGKLQMCRYNDTGPYHPDNCYKATQEQNLKDFYAKGEKRDQWYNNMMKTAESRRKPVVIEGTEFESITAAAKHYNMTNEGVGYRVKSKSPRFTEWKWK